VLPVAEIERIFQRHDAMFGDTYNAVYNTAIVLWAFLAQVLADGKMRSCAAAVARVGDFFIAIGKNPPSTDTGEYCNARKKFIAIGKNPPSTDTGEYCNARKKLDEKALHDLVVEAAGKIEYAAPDDWLWCGRHVKLVDGFTATMPDTPQNQEEFPQRGVSAAEIAASGRRTSHHACLCDHLVGDRIYPGRRLGAVFRQADG